MPESHAQTEPIIATARGSTRPVSTLAHVRRAVRQGLAGVYPSRYGSAWRVPLDARLADLLRPGISILDVGAGAAPTVEPAARPPGTRYVGLDVSARELDRAPPGSYDEIVVGDAATFVPGLVDQFDLVVSWLALEHVADVPLALTLLRRYLRTGGTLLAQLAGRGWLSARINRLIPHTLAAPLAARLTKRETVDVFPAHYDACDHSRLSEALSAGWARADVQPLFAGARYFEFSRPLLALALAYEEWAYRTHRLDLAAFYLIEAQA